MSRRKPYEITSASEGAPIAWRTLGEKNDPSSVQDRAVREFEESLSDVDVVTPPKKANANDPNDVTRVGRREFFLFAGASATLAACARRPVEKILPYTKAPEYALPGLSYHFATVRELRGEALGLLVEAHEGRPTKVEGNPDHPTSLGATDAMAQALVWNLYDPDRSTAPTAAGKEITWEAFEKEFKAFVASLPASNGAKLRVLAAPSISPTFVRLRDAVKARLSGVQFHTFASVNESNVRQGTKLAFGEAANPVYAYDQAAVVLALDADVFDTEAGAVRAAKQFAKRRRCESPNDPMNRLYVVEPSLTVTGSTADHRLRLPSSQVEAYAIALAKELASKHAIDLGPLGSLDAKVDVPATWIAAVAKELAANKGKSVVVAGARQPARVHALVHAINKALLNDGSTVSYYPVADKDQADDQLADLKALTKDLEAGKVEQLIILGGDPVRQAPSDLKFAEALKKAKTVIAVTTHQNETAKASTWHVPLALELETWGDLRSQTGVVAIQQPLIAPLHGAKSEIEILAALANETAKGYELVRATLVKSGGFLGTLDKAWAEALKKGVLSTVVTKALAVPPKSAEIAAELQKAKRADAPSAQNLEVTFAPDSRLFDGRNANNPWMLELPCPVSKISWDNAAFVSPTTAKAIGIETGDVLRFTKDGAQPIDVAAWILPGQGDNTIALTLGWGYQEIGRYGDRHGFFVEPLRTSDAFGFATGVKVQKLGPGEIAGISNRFADLGKASEPGPIVGRTGPVAPFDVDTKRYRFVQTQEHASMEGRAIAIDATLAEYKANPKFPQFPYEDKKDEKHSRPGTPDPKVLPLWKPVDYSKGSPTNPSGFKWGMAIDMNACTGCNACVVACQAENNIPAVGKEQVMRGREMAWLRIDRYFIGIDENDPKLVFQPVACVQCEEAPCENVCPVNATEHSPEGLNDIAYNRCIGTRYCANNCPYKVRRFNYLNYNGLDGEVPEVERMQKNPNVTVRMRGVIEKCSYCVQRIQEGKISAKREGRTLKDGDIKSACMQACPTEAIAFGDLNDPTSRVARLRGNDRAYRLLAEIGTHPRTSHLGKIRNLNPEMG
jgi:molybdopterin-containing oxidoreductase family iron-sulfur binding subunit